MKTNTDKKRCVTKITTVCDEALRAEVDQHRKTLSNMTGLSVTMSAATAVLIRAGLNAFKERNRCP